MLSFSGLRSPNLIYRYRLLHQPDVIRLIELLPSADIDQVIKCRIVYSSVASTATRKAYEALSYTWGDIQDSSETIQILGRFSNSKPELSIPRKVRPNLYAALKRLRFPDKSRYLWVDAICINQEDVQERNQQVAIMRKIYHSAQKAVIWLGDQEDDGITLSEIDAALGCVCYIRQQQVEAYNMEPQPVPEMRTRIPVFALTMGLTSKAVSHTWTAIARLFQRPWFFRIWTMQEIIMAKSAILVWGPRVLDWDIVNDAAQSIKFASSYDLVPVDPILKGVETVYKINAFKELISDNAYVPLIYSLATSRNRSATDPLDKIYAVLGVLDPVLNQASPVDMDYARDFREMYETVARILISASKPDGPFGPFVALSCVSPVADLSWPSWVPDWRETDVPEPFQLIDPEFDVGTAQPRADYHFTGDGKVLCVHGTVVDKIAEVGDPYTLVTLPVPDRSSDLVQAHFQHTKRWFEQCLAIYSRHSCIAPTQMETVSSPFWRSLVCNRMLNGTLITDSRADEKRDEIFSSYLAFRYFYIDNAATRTLDAEGKIQNAELEDDAGRFEGNMKYWTKGRAFFATEQGWIGWGPRAAEKGDLVVAFHGGKVPFVLRPKSGVGAVSTYRLIGECFLLLDDGMTVAEMGLESKEFSIV